MYLAYRTFTAIGGVRGFLSLLGLFYRHLALVIATVTAYVGCFALFHVAMSLLTGTKLRRVRIFISFKHDFESLANELGNGLEDHDIDVVRLPFRDRRDHDDVIAESLQAVTHADAIVAVPGPEPSWMANELGHAVGSKKPIVVIKHLADQQLSDSLYRGYPVFGWEELRTSGLIPLRRFLTFVTKSRGDVWPQFRRSVAGFGEAAVPALVGWGLFSAVLKEVSRFIILFAPQTAKSVVLTWTWSIFVVFAVAFAIGFVAALSRRL